MRTRHDVPHFLTKVPLASCWQAPSLDTRATHLHHAHVDDAVVVAAEHNPHDVLPDIMHVPLRVPDHMHVSIRLSTGSLQHTAASDT